MDTELDYRGDRAGGKYSAVTDGDPDKDNRGRARLANPSFFV